MANTVALSTIIDAEVKKALQAYCERNGLKMRAVIERGIVEQIEDEIDLRAYRDRRDEPTLSLEELLAGTKA
jgi:antitoxin component of RelBE/YafQ-DinJ toxin-antitoxin module